MSEYPDVFHETKPKAMKVHRCCECDGQIMPGETYQRIEGLWDGRWRTYKTCDECSVLRESVRLTCKHWEDEPTFGNLFEDIFEYDAIEEHPAWFKSFLATRRKRQSPVSHKRWMERREDEHAGLPPGKEAMEHNLVPLPHIPHEE